METDDDARRLTLAVQNHMASSGITQSALSEMMGMNPATVSKQFQRELRLPVFIKICAVMKMSPDQFFTLAGLN